MRASRSVSRAIASVLVVSTLLGCLTPVNQGSESAGAGKGAADAGAAVLPCLETSRAITGDTLTPIGASAAGVTELVTRPAIVTLTWVTGVSTQVRLQASKVSAEFVESRVNPKYDVPYTNRRCVPYIRVTASLRIRTADDAFDDRFEPLTLIAYDAEEVRGDYYIAAEDIGGSYFPAFRTRSCYVGSLFHLLFTVAGSNGAIIDELRTGGCDDEAGGVSQYAGGHWGERWMNY